MSRTVNRPALVCLLSVALCSVAALFCLLPGTVTSSRQVSKSNSAEQIARSAHHQHTPATGEPTAKLYDQIPLSFEPNLGQTVPGVKFISRGRGYGVELSSNRIMIITGKSAAAMQLVGADSSAKVAGIDQLAGTSSYFIGSDPQHWRTSIPTYGRVRYEDVYPGIDLVFYGTQREFEYDFVVAPGADPKTIRLGFASAAASAEKSAFDLEPSGDLIATANHNGIRFHKPFVYQVDANGDRVAVEGRYMKLGRDVGFQIGNFDRRRALIIDPVMTFSSFIGGTNDDAVASVSVAIDAAGNTYVASGTISTDFPVTAGSAQGSFGGSPAICDQFSLFCGDAFVAKINASGTAILYSTYLGGSDSDYAFGLAVDPAGNAYITGYTKSSNFPVVSAFQPSFGGAPAVCDSGDPCGDVFVTKINPTGSALVYSTYLGGSDNEYAEAIAVDNQGNAYVTGATASSDFPTTPGSFQPTFTGNLSCIGRSGANRPCTDSFVTKISPTGRQEVYSTYLGGFSGDEDGFGIAADSAGRAYIAGNSCGTDFPTTPSAFQKNSGGICDGFFTTLDSLGKTLLYSSYLGGNGYDSPYSMAIDSAGNAYLTGQTSSSDFPVTAGAFQTVAPGDGDAFVAKFNPKLSGAASLVYSTFLGGTNTDIGAAITADAQGNAYAAGQTFSSDFPTLSPIQATVSGGGDAYLTELNPNGTAILFSTFLGGSSVELIDSVAVDPTGAAYIAGWTRSADFPTTSGVFQPSFAGGNRDVFVAKVDTANAPGVSIVPASLAFGAQAVGTSSPPQTVIIHNLGSTALSITAVRTQGDFTQTTNCGGTVAGGGSCAVSIVFKPATTGNRKGSLGVSDNAGGSPQKISLTGAGK